MFHIKSIDIDNFGPYKDHVNIDFSDKEGVTLIWGNNGVGKTSLIRAIKYVLYDEIPEYTDKSNTSIFLTTNNEMRNQGEYGFSVSLEFYDGEYNYVLIRTCKPSQDSDVDNEPRYNNQYVKTTFLKKNGVFCNQNDMDHILSTLMPKDVSRFFVFDGELLKEYEELLVDDSNAADKIKNAIESILGLPIITNAKRDIEKVENLYNSKVATEAKKNNKTKSLGDRLSEKNESLVEHQKLLEESVKRISELEKEKNQLEDESKKYGKYHDMIQSAKSLDNVIKEIQVDIDEKKSRLSEIINESWKSMCNVKIYEYVENVKNEIKKLEDEKKNVVVIDEILKYMKHAHLTGDCEVCGSTRLTPEIKSNLAKKIDEFEHKVKVLSPEDEQRLSNLKSVVLPRLANKANYINKELINALESDIDGLKIKKMNKTEEKNDIQKNIDNYEDAVRNDDDLVNRRVINGKSLDLARARREEENITIERLKTEIEELKRQIRQNEDNSNELALLSKQAEFCRNLKDLFKTSEEQFKKQLKEKVQRDASEIFVNISAQKEYIGLSINDNYGLEIVHKSGDIVPLKSAGYSHIVALSLIGALHKNAPLEGPIIMDSPFGRLDSIHKQSVTKILPELAKQVILLSYDKEIDKDVAHDILGSVLINEYSLVQKSAFSTKVE